MGDVGDYWREHRAHKERQKRRDAAVRLGMSLEAYEKLDREIRREEQAHRHQEHIDRCTIQCECGRWFLHAAAHNLHRSHKGKEGHKVVSTKEPKAPSDPWDEAFTL
jgi:uncharacterized Rmd1/YagE family protein